MSDFTISMIRQAAAVLAPHVVRTPLLRSPVLDAALGLRLFVKAENLQITGSFKLRGALNKVLALDEAARRRGVITFSAGNHGQALSQGVVQGLVGFDFPLGTDGLESEAVDFNVRSSAARPRAVVPLAR